VNVASYNNNFVNRLQEALTDKIVIEILGELGSPPYSIKEDKIWFRTVCHGGDSHKLCYFKESHNFYCFTSCGSLSIFQLVSKCKRCTLGEAINYVSRKTGLSIRNGFHAKDDGIAAEIQQMERCISMRRKTKSATQRLATYDPNVLAYFDADTYYDGWIREGIGVQTMMDFGIRWYELEKCIIIPHYNAEKRLVGIRRRSLKAADAHNKYMPLCFCDVLYSHPLGFNLYGLDMHQEAIRQGKKVLIVESEKSVMLAHEYYGRHAFAVASCGFNVSNWQRDTLLDMGVEEVILGLDKDFDPLVCDDETHPQYLQYCNYMERILRLAQKFSPFCRTYVLWDNLGLLGIKDSPLDKGKATLETLMRNKIEVTA
jgi:hypothetical protein